MEWWLTFTLFHSPLSGDKVFTIECQTFVMFSILLSFFFLFFFWREIHRKQLYENYFYQVSRSLTASPNAQRKSTRFRLHLVLWEPIPLRSLSSLEVCSWPGITRILKRVSSAHWAFPKQPMPILSIANPSELSQTLQARAYAEF